jgi:hypothetical protein
VTGKPESEHATAGGTAEAGLTAIELIDKGGGHDQGIRENSMADDLRPTWAKRMATRRNRSDGLYERWKACCVYLPKAKFGDGVRFRDRLHIYAGAGVHLTEDSTLHIGHRWIGFCCRCGKRVEKVTWSENRASNTPAKMLRPDSSTPQFGLPQDCHECRKPGAKPDGFTPAALDALKAARLPWRMISSPGHYHLHRVADGPMVLTREDAMAANRVALFGAKGWREQMHLMFQSYEGEEADLDEMFDK